MNRTVSRLAVIAVSVGVLIAGAGDGFAQASTDEQMELIEARAALEIAKRKLTAFEVEVKELESTRLALGESLAAANAEADQYRESYHDIRLQMEALGIEAIKPDSEGVERRLLKAVSDIRLIEEEKQELAGQLMRLTEAAMNYMKTAVSPESEHRAILEEELKIASGKIGLNREIDPASIQSIDRAQVVSLKPEYGLIVVDAGAASGVRVGMPLQLIRGEQIIGKALVIDVRSGIAGALIQNVEKEGGRIQIGDKVEIETLKTL